MPERRSKRRRLNERVEGKSATPVSMSQYGNTTVAGHATVHLGDVHDVHHHHYNRPSESAGPDEDQDILDKLRVLKDSLTFQRMDARLLNVSSAYPKTCDWLFRHKNFLAWNDKRKRAEHNGFLWIKGKPGCGKSTIMKNALEHVRRRRNKNRTIITYFFNARAPASLEKSSLGLYRSLVHQLLCAVPTLGSLFVNSYIGKVRTGSVDEWTEVELQGFLVYIVRSPLVPPLYIFIDALDEGEDDSDVRRLIDFLENLALHAGISNTSLRICLSSRHYPHITIRKGLCLVVEDECDHQQDITLYVRNKLYNIDCEDMEAFRQNVCIKSAGIFLWIVLVIPLLNHSIDKGGGLKAMQKCLHQIPPGLEGLFEKILSRNVEDTADCVSLLQWVLFSTRPLSVDELCLAMQYSSGSCRERPNLPEKCFRSRYILDCSRGLVEETKTSPPVIQFIHETAREFLKSTHGVAKVQRSLSNNLAGLSHVHLQRGCLACLALSATVPADHHDLTQAIRAESPFVEYAASSLFHHAEFAQQSGESQDTFLRELSQSNSNTAFRQWIRYRNAFERYKVRKYRIDVPLLYVLAEQNLPQLAEVLLDLDQVMVNANRNDCRFGFALQAASHWGHETVVQCLLKKGADVNLQGGEHQCAFTAAIMGKNFAIAKLLHKYGARVESSLLERLVIAMVTRGSVEGVEFLLELGVSVHSSNANGTPLVVLAFHKKNVEMVKVLLQRGANVAAGTLRGYTMLHEAIVERQGQMVAALLDAGADVNKQSGPHSTALQAASMSGQRDVSIVESLLAHGARVNAQGGVFGSALQAASANPSEPIVQLLLKRGADVNAKGGRFGTALQAACATASTDIVELLLEHGARINEKGGIWGNALCAAAARNQLGSASVIKILLDHGADIVLEGVESEVALVVAARQGCFSAVEVLIDETIRRCLNVDHLREVVRSALVAVDSRNGRPDSSTHETERMKDLLQARLVRLEAVACV